MAINATQAEDIRAQFAANARALYPAMHTARNAGNTTLANMIARQIGSYENMAGRRFEAMAVVATIR